MVVGDVGPLYHCVKSNNSIFNVYTGSVPSISVSMVTIRPLSLVPSSDASQTLPASLFVT